LEVDLRFLIRSARRWWWILLLIPALTAALGIVYTKRQPYKYQADAQLIVNPSGDQAFDYNSIMSAPQLTKTYQKLIKNTMVLDAAAQQLNNGLTGAQIGGMVRASTDGDTQLLSVTAVDTDPVRAAAVANAVADQFAKYVKNQGTTSNGQTLAQLQAAYDQVDAQIKATQAQITTLQAQKNADSQPVKNQIANLQATLDTLQPTYTSLLTNLATAKAASAVSLDRVSVAVPAVAPTAPFAPSLPVNLLLALFAGGLIAVGVIRVLVYFDNTVKMSSDFLPLVGAPLLSTVQAVKSMIAGKQQVFVLDQPKSAAAESIRLLRTNIEFASASREIASIGVTSASPGEGKSTIAANLAVTLAQAGFQTALLDTDLRRPTQHQIFGVANDRGMSTLLTAADRPWSWAAHETMTPNLTLIPSGPLPPNPADLLSLDRLRQILTDMRSSFDVIVIDTPPVLAVSDPLIIAAHVDGMIVVAKAGKTRLDSIREAAETLHRGSIRIIGVVINQQTGKTDGGYYYNDYHAVAERPLRPFNRKPASAELVAPAD
jgi:succinoglycan biosynthesis transport protein ExoP